MLCVVVFFFALLLECLLLCAFGALLPGGCICCCCCMHFFPRTYCYACPLVLFPGEAIQCAGWLSGNRVRSLQGMLSFRVRYVPVYGRGGLSCRCMMNRLIMFTWVQLP